VVSGTGTVLGSPDFSGRTLTVQLGGIADSQTLGINLTGVTDQFGRVLPNKTITMNVLVGDTTGSSSVNASDVSLTKSQSGMPVTEENFYLDVTMNGAINASDVGLVKSRSGAAISPMPAKTLR